MKHITKFFRVCDFSEQFITGIDCYPPQSHDIYSATMHADGVVYKYQQALHPQYSPPITALRSQAWLALLQQIAEKK